MSMQTISANGLSYPGIYNINNFRCARSGQELFNDKVNEFIGKQIEKLPFKDYEPNRPQVIYVYQRRPYFYSSSFFSIRNETNIFTPGSIEAKNKRDNQVLAALVSAVVAFVASYLLGYYVNEYKSINEEVEDIEEFKNILPKNQGHKHLEALEEIAKLRLKELHNAKGYTVAKLAITVSTLASAIFLGIAALAAPELMGLAAIVTGLNLVAGTIIGSLSYFDKGAEKIAIAVRKQLDFLSEVSRPLPFTPDVIHIG